jgi:hypothetical protein
MCCSQCTCNRCHAQVPLRGAAATLAALHNEAARNAERAWLVELLVDVPTTRPNDERGWGADLQWQSRTALLKQREELRWGLTHHPNPPEWWVERFQQLERALSREP